MFVMTEIIVVLDNVRSTHNVGSILRTADGLGVTKVVLTGYTPYPKVANDERLPHEIVKQTNAIKKTALGAELTMNIERYENIHDAIAMLKKINYLIISLEQNNDSIPIDQLEIPDKLALIVGNEVDGVNVDVLGKSDSIVEIPMEGKKESFNVSVAAGIAVYALNSRNKLNA